MFRSIRELVVGANQRPARRIPLGAVGRIVSKSHRVGPIQLIKIRNRSGNRVAPRSFVPKPDERLFF